MDTRNILRRLKLSPNTYIGKRIGTPSTNGAIYEMANNKVLKIMNNVGYADFMNEVSVGRIPGIEKVGTRIYEYAFFNNTGVYVMDNLITDRNTRNGNRLMSLREYWNTCHKATDHEKKMFTYLLYDFYKLTNGYHADLHGDNIQAIVGPDGTLKKLKIIDYGSHTKLKKNIRSLRCLDHILDVIQEEFNRVPCEGGQCYWGPNAGIHKFPTTGLSQQIIGNARVLRRSAIQPLFNKNLAAINNLNRFRMINSVKSIFRRTPAKRARSPPVLTSIRVTPVNGVGSPTSKKTERGRRIYRGPRGGRFVFNSNGTKNYKRAKLF